MAHQALCALYFITQGKGHVPLPLKIYMLEDAAKFMRPRGRQTGPVDWVRDSAIAAAVLMLSESNGISRTRKRTREGGTSACSIVADVLRQFNILKTEEAVEKISEKHRGTAALLWFEGGKIPSRSETK